MARSGFAAALFAALIIAGPAAAETRIFLLDGTDGYGIDRCLLAGDRCGEAAAAALCRARNYASVLDYGRVDPAEITGGVPAGLRVQPCQGASCPTLVAITCTR